MKPLRRLMSQIEQIELDMANWSEAVDASKTPKPGPVTADDMVAAIEATKSSAQAVPLLKYEKWMKEFGSM
jgi:hypothetical protein